MHIKLTRVYDTPTSEDGVRILVDRLWPRGVKKTELQYDAWLKALAPSAQLRQWYHAGKGNERWAEFARRYEKELRSESAMSEVERLRRLSRRRNVTLLTATKNPEASYLCILKRIVNTD